MKRRYCIVAFDPNGDMGYGSVLGPFVEDRAEKLAADMQAMIDHFDLSMTLLVLPTMHAHDNSPLALVEKIKDRF